MLITVDQIDAHQIAYRSECERYYYTVAGFENLLLVTQGARLEQLQGERAILLWNYDQIDSTIVCDSFPDAPEHWRDQHIIQATITQKERMKGAIVPLSEALRRGYHEKN